jgi:hypothetical protein
LHKGGKEMPIPLLVVGLAAAAVGAGKSIKAGVDQKDAKETNERAQDIVDEATGVARVSRERCNKALEALGRKKLWVLDNGVHSFVQSFEQIHNLELEETEGISELKQIRLGKKELLELKNMSATASSMLGSVTGGAAGGVAVGALAALGAYGGAATFGTCATTGTAIATLSGVVAQNATLAFLGGGALSVGGLGVAGGVAVLGGLVAGPALAVMGFVAGAKAKANKDAAYSNLSEARRYKEQVKTVQVMCKGIRVRANMFERLLIQLDAVLAPLNESLSQILQTRGTDYTKYSAEDKKTVSACLAVVKAIKTVLDTPILTEDGTLTEESQALVAPTQKLIQAYANS